MADDRRQRQQLVVELDNDVVASLVAVALAVGDRSCLLAAGTVGRIAAVGDTWELRIVVAAGSLELRIVVEENLPAVADSLAFRFDLDNLAFHFAAVDNREIRFVADRRAYRSVEADNRDSVASEKLITIQTKRS